MKKILAIVTIIGVTLGSSVARADDVVIQQTLEDGVTIAVHYDPDELSRYHTPPPHYADKVLRYAAEAYHGIVYKQGFNTPGFTYANPDKNYCHDEDKTIDVIIGGQDNSSNSPYFDIAKGEGTDYDAFIFFPADYEGYLRQTKADYGTSTIVEKMKGTLFHEMLHVIIYSYNKNIEPWYSYSEVTSRYQGGDWYVEGLARYFETIGGSYDNFFSRGYIKQCEDNIIIAQEGVNYLTQHPSQSLEEARYEYSLFWAYIHRRYRMSKIEELSRKFRFVSKGAIKDELPVMVSAVMGTDFKEVLREFAVALYCKSFAPVIREGLDDVRVMSLADFSEIPEREVASWASNFIMLDLDDGQTPEVISLRKTQEGEPLVMTVIVGYGNGQLTQIRDLALEEENEPCTMYLDTMKQYGITMLTLIITNVSPNHTMSYEVSAVSN
jgi:hypothetical protein